MGTWPMPSVMGSQKWEGSLIWSCGISIGFAINRNRPKRTSGKPSKGTTQSSLDLELLWVWNLIITELHLLTEMKVEKKIEVKEVHFIRATIFKELQILVLGEKKQTS